MTRSDPRAAAKLGTFPPADFRPRWDPDVLAAANPEVVRTFVLSTKALQVLLGTEVAGQVRPVSLQHVHKIDPARLDWINVARPSRRYPTRAYRRADVDAYFRHVRGIAAPPYHRLPPDLRTALGLDY